MKRSTQHQRRPVLHLFSAAVLLALLPSLPAAGQSACRRWIERADAAYKEGRFEVLLGPNDCLPGGEDVSQQERDEALKLLALTFIVLDQDDKALAIVKRLAASDVTPRFDDPAEFRRLLKRVRGAGGIEVFTASKTSESLLEAPAAVVVVTARQIQEWGVRDLKDVLRRAVPGYQVIADRDEWVFAARGNLSDNNNKYLILVDGHRVNSVENFGPGQFIESPNDLSNVKQIEIIKGPGSAIWGSDALAGVINIVTKDVTDLEDRRRRASVTLGQDATYRMNFQIAHRTAGREADLIFMGSVGLADGAVVRQSSSTGLPRLDEGSETFSFDSTGVRTAPFGTQTTALDRHDPGYMLQLKARVGRFRLNSLAFSTSTYNRQFEIERGRENFLTTERYFVEGIWSGELGRKDPGEEASGWGLTWKLSADSNRAEYRPTRGESSLFISWVDERIGTSLDVRRSLGGFVPDDPERRRRFDLSAGIEYVRTDLGPTVLSNPLDPDDPQPPPGPLRASSFLLDRQGIDNSYGTYFMVDYRPSSRYKLTAGGRLDFNSDRGKDELVLTPRLALIRLLGTADAIKILYNTGFLRPANFQLFPQAVESERMQQLDLVYMKEFGGSVGGGEATGDEPKHPFRLTATLYWQRLEGFINTVVLPDPATPMGLGSGFANAGDYESTGIEVGLSKQLGKRGNHDKDPDRDWTRDLWLNLAYSDAKQKNFPEEGDIVLPLNSRRITPGGRLLNYAPLTINAGATLYFGDRFFISPALRFVSATDYRVAAPACPVPLTKVDSEERCLPPPFRTLSDAEYAKTDGFTYLDVNLGFEPREGFRLNLYVDNLLDVDDPAPLSVHNGTIDQYGRYAEMTLRFSFP